jgi:hypothetical protein
VTPEKALETMRALKKQGRAEHWQDLEPVIAAKGKGPLQCYLKCIKEGGGCGQLLTIYNTSARAKDHFKASACKGVRQAQGQAHRTEIE